MVAAVVATRRKRQRRRRSKRRMRRRKRTGRKRRRRRKGRRMRRGGGQIVGADRKQRRGQRYCCCHISGQHLPTAALILSRADITSNGFKVPTPPPTCPSSPVSAPPCCRSGGGAESPAGTSACGHPQSISICSPPPPLCSFFPISEPLEVIRTLECEELSPRMRLGAGGEHIVKKREKEGVETRS